MKLSCYWHCFAGIQRREWLRFWQQRSRLASALVRPLLWLLVFAAGFRAVLGISIIPPYQTYITYETYILPGLCCMILLFNGMQGSLSMVYDREMGSMRVLLMSPLPRPFLLLCKLLATALVSLIQVYAFLAIAWCFDIRPPLWGLLAAAPALLLAALPDKALAAQFIADRLLTASFIATFVGPITLDKLIHAATVLAGFHPLLADFP
mgnify:CR=1 FL=1